MKYLILTLIFSSQVMAYTLNNNFGASFGSNNVKVYVDEQTTCANAGITVYELNDMIKPAINRFWNRVPTSALNLKQGNFSSTTNNINTGKLCAPTDEDCITNAGATVIAPVKDIVIACNNNTDNFGSGVLAVTIPNSFSGKKITGSVILINDTNATKFDEQSKSAKISVIAHEIGHAIGLGHSEDDSALMYYRVQNHRNALGEDDMKGVSYLYPVKLTEGCTIFGATVGPDRIDPQFWQLGIGFLLAVVLMSLRKFFKRLT